MTVALLTGIKLEFGYRLTEYGHGRLCDRGNFTFTDCYGLAGVGNRGLVYRDRLGFENEFPCKADRGFKGAR